MSDTIKIIREPAVYLLGRQVIDEGELDRFLDDHGIDWQTDAGGDAEALCEVAGRVCYMSFARPRPGGNAAYLKHILEVGHGSVTEHAVWNFLFTGISRSLSHELVRHRVGWSYSQLSQRYVDESVAEYVEPPSLADEIAAAYARFRQSWEIPAFDAEECDCLLSNRERPLTAMERAGVFWFKTVAQTRESYRHLTTYLAEKLKPAGVRKAETDPSYAEELGGLAEMNATDRRKQARQAARSVLPNATETKVFATANARAIRHFVEMRASRHADVEIRKLAVAVLRLMQREAPHLFGDYTLTPLPDGTFEATTPYRKV